MKKKSRDRRVARRKEQIVNFKVDTDNYHGGEVQVITIEEKK